MANALDIPASLEKAKAYHRAGRLAEAEALYRRILEAAPGHGETLHLLGALALEHNRPDAAYALVAQALAADKNAKYYTTLGRAALRLGRTAEALGGFRAATALEPGMTVAHFLAGTTLRALGRPHEAQHAFERTLASDPDFVHAMFHLGALSEEAGRLEAAIGHYRDAVARTPDFAEAQLNLGICLARSGDRAAARTHLETAARLRPDLPETAIALGNLLVELGELEPAIAAYRQALARDPDAAVAHFNLGNAFRAQGRLEAAIMAYRDALEADPRLAQAAINAAGASADLGRNDEAEELYRRALMIDPGAVHGHVGLATALRRRGALAEALAAAERAVQLDPQLPDAHTALGLCHQEHGQLEAAAAAFRRALAIDPEHPTALYNLVGLRGVEPDASEAARVEQLLAKPTLPPASRAGLHFACARLADARGDYDKAFHHYQEANTLLAVRRPDDHEAVLRHIKTLIATFDEGFFAARRKLGSESGRPIFIVGMPRSGTTLVEQILASHPEVHGAGEAAATDRVIEQLNRWPAIAQARLAYPEAARLIEPELAAALAERYLAVLGREAGNARRVTDKLPFNFLRLGLIACILPRAPIIHCRRDPFDTCWSCYIQDFREVLPFTTGLDRLGRYYCAYERLMAHWRQVLPTPMLEVPYEALVADPETWCRRILDHCGLSWDDRVRRFFATERSVRTASYWQVRQPIYQSSIDRWRNYRRHLGPLFEALGRAPEADDAA